MMIVIRNDYIAISDSGNAGKNVERLYIRCFFSPRVPQAQNVHPVRTRFSITLHLLFFCQGPLKY